MKTQIKPTTTAAAATPESHSPSLTGILQRKCACGSPTSSLTGECTECKSGLPLQKKLSVGASNDPLEQEADRIAEQVLATSTHSSVSGAPPHIQRFTGQANGDADTAPASVDRVLASSGRPLDSALRQDMEQRFGHDFSQVRVHSGSVAEQSAREVNANAYAVGRHIVFGEGRFAPATHEGRRLIAHELSHVAQQGGDSPKRAPVVPVLLQRAPGSGPVAAKSYQCTSVKLVKTSMTLYGNHGPIRVTVQPLDIPSGSYKVALVKGILLVESPSGVGWAEGETGEIVKVLNYSWNLRKPQSEIDAFTEKLAGYVQSLTSPVTLTVIGTLAKTSGTDQSTVETGTGSEAGDLDVSPSEDGSKEQEETGTGSAVIEPDLSAGTGGETGTGDKVGGERGGGEKADSEYDAKLKALMEGGETTPLDPETSRELKIILDKLSIDDIALFKSLAIFIPGDTGDIEAFLSSLRLFESAKEVFENMASTQGALPAEAPDETQKILADAEQKYRDDMTQDEKEALARDTVRKLSNEQLASLTPGKVAEGIVRIDKQVMGMGEEMGGGVSDLIHGTGWEKAAGAARATKGAAGFWGFLSFAALIVASFVPGLNVLAFALAANALVAGMVAYAAANIQREAEIQAASRATSPEERQEHHIGGASARTEVVIATVVMALPIAGKLIGQLPVPAALKNVSTTLQSAKDLLKQKSGEGFAIAKQSVLDALGKAKGDLQLNSIEFRQTIASIVKRLRGAKGTDLLKEITNTPELQDLVPAETVKNLEGLSPTELEVARDGIIEALDNAPPLAEESLKNLDNTITALESKVQAVKSAEDLEGVLAEAANTTDPERLLTEAGKEAVVTVVQNRAAKISNLSVSGVKADVGGLLTDVEKLPNTNPHRKDALKELKTLYKEVRELEPKQTKTDISQQLEDISRRVEELDDLVADAVVEANQSRRQDVGSPTKRAVLPNEDGEVEFQLSQKAGRVAEEFWTSISNDIHNTKDFPTKFGPVEPDFMPPKADVRKLDANGRVLPAENPKDALLIADSKVLTKEVGGGRVVKSIGLTDQLRGLVELARETVSKTLVLLGQEGVKISRPLREYGKAEGVEIEVKTIVTPSGAPVKG